MKSDRSPQLALIVVWPHSVPAPAVRQVTRRLLENRVRVTWAVDQANQIETLASWGTIRAGADAALRAEPGDDLAVDDAGREMARRLDLVRATGLPVDVVLADSARAGGHWPRTLRGLGVHGLVVDGTYAEGVARALPFGVWQFTPRVAAPQVRGWGNWFGKTRAPLVAANRGSAVVAVDLARLGASGSRAWRDVEATFEEAVSLSSRGAARLATVSELAAQLTQANAPRPQRSILRAAA